MSDGDNATPDRRPPDGDDQWLTRARRPLPGAAPWERREARPRPPDDDPAGDDDRPEGVTVADLIAKIAADGAGPSDERTRHRATPEPAPEPPAPPTEILEAVIPAYYGAAEEAYYNPPANPPADFADADEEDRFGGDGLREDDDGGAEGRDDTEIIPVARLDEVPDLTALRRSDRVPPSRIGSGRAAAPAAEPRRHRKTMVAGRAAAALIAVLALALTGGAWQWQTSKNNSLNKVSALDRDSRDIIDPNAQFGDENFLIVGVDSRFGQNSEMGAGDTEDAGGARSDTVMLVNIPANRERVVAVSFPRDLAIDPMKCAPWNPETGQYGPLYDDQTETYGPDEVYTETKLNSAYSFGGPKCLVKVVQKLSGLSVNRFMAVDFAGFSKMVDALGGVEVCSTTPLEDYELGTVLENAGPQMVDGHTALNYVRARQVTTEINGDYGRIKRQQLFLSSLLRSLISKDTFFSLSKLNNVVNMFINDSFVDNIGTKDLVDLGQSIQGVSAGRITFVTVPTGETDSEGNEPPRTGDMRALFDAIINDDPLPGEKNADNTPVPGSPESTTSAAETPSATPEASEVPPVPGDAGEVVDAVTTDPKDVTVQVSNSTGENGLAATAASELQQHGFNVASPDDYPGALPATTVFFSPGNEQAAATVASTLANPTIERVSDMGQVVRVVLGSDFYAVSAPSPSGSPVQVRVLRGSAGPPTRLPEDLTVTNAADTTCE